MMFKPTLLRTLFGRDPRAKWAALYARLETQSRIALALARAAATSGCRTIDPKDPETWQFSGFSQNGEDGIIDYLCAHVERKNRFFVEIGSSDGLENNTSWMAMAKRYGGLMVEGDSRSSSRCRDMYKDLNLAVHCINLFVDVDNIASLLKLCPFKDPDLFSLDVDGIDFYIARKVLDLGYRPKVWSVEYNSAFGPERSVTVVYKPRFDRVSEHASWLYYGVSITAWRTLLEARGYRFITVDSNGINAFFIDPAAFPDGFATGVKQETFRENALDLNGATSPRKDASGDLVMPPRDWRSQFSLIQDKEFVTV
jgi:hypothetical protein